MLEKLKKLVKERDDVHPESLLDKAGIDYEEVYDSGWEDEGKYQLSEIVYNIKNTNYLFLVRRSGSYFSDYYYQIDEVYEAEEVTETVTRIYWKAK